MTFTQAQVIIGNDDLPADPSSILDVRSIEKGLLAPRMTAAQMLAIQNPAAGLIVFNSSSEGTWPDQYLAGYYYYNGMKWVAFSQPPGLSHVTALSQAQIDIMQPIAGDVVLNTSTNCLNYYSGLSWMELCGYCTPQPSQANAGENQTIIGIGTILSANTPAFGSGQWSIVNGNGGTFSDPFDPSSSFSGTQPENYILSWSITNNCGSNSDEVLIKFINQPPPPSEDLVYTPYVDCCLWPNFQIENVGETGISLYTCAFIVDNQYETGANPCWGGFSTLGMDYYQTNIASLRSQGGDVIMSFGGANGIELAYAAQDEFEARDAYKEVIDAYNLTSLDFDIEGFFVAEPLSISRRSKAMKLLQNEYPNLMISLTLPVLPTGLTADGLNVVQSAINEEVDLFCINIMAMDYGPSGLDMGDAAISAGEALFLQLKDLYEEADAGLPDSLIWRKVGITPMIGQNDVPGEIFYQDDANDLATWAAEKKINRLAIWSANRDKQCENSGDPLYQCSHITQALFEFSGIFGAVAGD